MGPKKIRILSEAALTSILRVACIHMNLSDAYLFLAYLYNNDVAATGFGAYSQDKAAVKWHYAINVLAYIRQRGSKVRIPAIQRPEIETQGCIPCATAILNMERELSEILQDLQDFFIRDGSILKFTTELLFKQRRDEERLRWEIEKLKAREEEAQAQKKDGKNKTPRRGSPRKRARK